MRIIYIKILSEYLFYCLIDFITKVYVKKLTILIVYKAINIMFRVNNTECILINVDYIYFYKL